MFLKQNPELIEEIILTKKNTYGLHALRIYINNQEEHILIDDKFLCTSGDLKCVFSQPLEQQIWPLIIEKAWIKYAGSLTDIEYRQPFEPYKLFTNRPYGIIPIKELSL